MANGKNKDDDEFEGVAGGATERDDEGVAEGAVEDEPAEEKGASKAKESGKGRADKTKQDDADEDQSFGKKGKGSGK